MTTDTRSYTQFAPVTDLHCRNRNVQYSPWWWFRNFVIIHFDTIIWTFRDQSRRIWMSPHNWSVSSCVPAYIGKYRAIFSFIVYGPFYRFLPDIRQKTALFCGSPGFIRICVLLSGTQFPISQITYSVSFTKNSLLMQCRKIIALYCHIHNKCSDTGCWPNEVSGTLMQVVHTFTSIKF